MDEWLSFFDSLNRKLPFLWLGPAAAGHLKPPAPILGQGNNALWHFNVEMGKEARAREMEVLGMYNATLQASSWDGTGYGVRVALMQAMMVCTRSFWASEEVVVLTEGTKRSSTGYQD
jgi:hypothetical protein